MYKNPACSPLLIISLCLNPGTISYLNPNSKPASPWGPVGRHKEGGQGKGQAWSSIGERQWHRKQSRRQIDQQMVSFRCIPEDDRAAGHMQSESERDRRRRREEKSGLQLKSFSFSFSLAAPPRFPSSLKDNSFYNLLEGAWRRARGREREERRDSPKITLICKMVHTSPSVCQLG